MIVVSEPSLSNATDSTSCVNRTAIILKSLTLINLVLTDCYYLIDFGNHSIKMIIVSELSPITTTNSTANVIQTAIILKSLTLTDLALTDCYYLIDFGNHSIKMIIVS